jgi:predicted RNA-binding protein with PIN domain
MKIEVDVPGLGDLLDKLAGEALVVRSDLAAELIAYQSRVSAEIVITLDGRPTCWVRLNWQGIPVGISWWGTNEDTSPWWDASANELYDAASKMVAVATEEKPKWQEAIAANGGDPLRDNGDGSFTCLVPLRQLGTKR